MELVDLLMRTVEKKGSDLFLIPGAPATAKVGGALVAISEETLMPKDTERLVDEAYRLAGNAVVRRSTRAGTMIFLFRWRA